MAPPRISSEARSNIPATAGPSTTPAAGETTPAKRRRSDEQPHPLQPAPALRREVADAAQRRGPPPHAATSSLMGSFPPGFVPGPLPGRTPTEAAAPASVAPPTPAFDGAMLLRRRVAAQLRDMHRAEAAERRRRPDAQPDAIELAQRAVLRDVFLGKARPLGPPAENGGVTTQRFGLSGAGPAAQAGDADHTFLLSEKDGGVEVKVSWGAACRRPLPGASRVEASVSAALAIIRDRGWDTQGEGTGLAYLESAALLNAYMGDHGHGDMTTLKNKPREDVGDIMRGFIDHVGARSFPAQNLPGVVGVLTTGAVAPAAWPRETGPLRPVVNPLGLSEPEQAMRELAGLGSASALNRYIDTHWGPVLAAMPRQDVVRASEQPMVHDLALALSEPEPAGLDIRPLDALRIARHRFGVLSLKAVYEHGAALRQSGMPVRQIVELADRPDGFEAVAAAVGRPGA